MSEPPESTRNPGVQPTVLVAAAVVIRGSRVLLTQRPAKTHLAGKWEFPGGKVELAEDPAHAVVRECREECGIELAVDDILDVTFHAYASKNVLLLFYRCTLISGEVAHLGVADHRWASAATLRTFDFPTRGSWCRR